MQQFIPSHRDCRQDDNDQLLADRQPQQASRKTFDAVPAPADGGTFTEPDPLPDLRAGFPAFRIWREEVCGRARYIARSQGPGVHPYAVVTDDPDELRAALAPAPAPVCARRP
jgi:hypothetical protein